MRWRVMGARPKNPDDQAIYALLLAMYDSYGQSPRVRVGRAAFAPRLSLTLRVGICGGALAVTMLSSAGTPVARESVHTTLRSEGENRPMGEPHRGAPPVQHSWRRDAPTIPAAAARPVAVGARRSRTRERPLIMPANAVPSALPSPARLGTEGGSVQPPAPVAPAAPSPPLTIEDGRDHAPGEDGGYVEDEEVQRRTRSKQALDALRTVRLH